MSALTHLLLDHFQFALIHGPNLQVPMQYCSLQPWVLFPVTSTTGCCFCFGSIPSFFLELFLHWSLVAYWALTDLGVHLSVSYLFAFSYCSWGSQGKNTEVVCHSLLQRTTFCQNSVPWPVHLEWPYTAWLMVSLYETRLWSLWSVWLIFLFVVFILSSLWWIRIRGLWKLPDGRDLLRGKWSCSDGHGHAQ